MSHVEGYVGLMLGNLGSKSGPCWVIWVCYALLHGGEKELSQKTNFCEGSVLILFECVGPMLSHLGSMLGPCWVVW